MQNVFIINAHEPWPFSEGKLNRSMIERATANLKNKGYDTQITTMQDDYDVEKEIEKHMDEVYTAGMDGRLCTGDGRSREDKSKQYGSGGTLTSKKYMLSITYNAPLESFNNSNQNFFDGRGVDDLFWPMHLNFKFFGMTPLKTFACHDVLKNR